MNGRVLFAIIIILGVQVSVSPAQPILSYGNGFRFAYHNLTVDIQSDIYDSLKNNGQTGWYGSFRMRFIDDETYFHSWVGLETEVGIGQSVLDYIPGADKELLFDITMGPRFAVYSFGDGSSIGNFQVSFGVGAGVNNFTIFHTYLDPEFSVILVPNLISARIGQRRILNNYRKGSTGDDYSTTRFGLTFQLRSLAINVDTETQAIQLHEDRKFNVSGLLISLGIN